MQHHYPLRLNIRPTFDRRAENDGCGDDEGGTRPECQGCLPEAHDRYLSPCSTVVPPLPV
jgi:hypothetical protein